MTAFTDFLSAGFTFAVAQMGSTIAVGTETASCILSNPAATKEMRETGFWESCTCVAELLRTSFTTLKIEMRSECVIDERRWKVTQIENDPVDPCVRIGLVPAHA